MISDARFDALCAWLERALPVPMEGIAPASADASFRRYFRVTLQAMTVAAGGGIAGAHAHRHGRAAAAGGLPALRRGCRPAHRCGRARADGACRKPGARLFAALRSRHAHLSGGAVRRHRARAVSRRQRRARPLAAGQRRRRAAALRRSLAQARAQPVSRLVHREASAGSRSTTRKAPRSPARSSASSPTISASRACTSIAIIIRAI